MSPIGEPVFALSISLSNTKLTVAPGFGFVVFIVGAAEITAAISGFPDTSVMFIELFIYSIPSVAITSSSVGL